MGLQNGSEAPETGRATKERKQNGSSEHVAAYLNENVAWLS